MSRCKCMREFVGNGHNLPGGWVCVGGGYAYSSAAWVACPVCRGTGKPELDVLTCATTMPWMDMHGRVHALGGIAPNGDVTQIKTDEQGCVIPTTSASHVFRATAAEKALREATENLAVLAEQVRDLKKEVAHLEQYEDRAVKSWISARDRVTILEKDNAALERDRDIWKNVCTRVRDERNAAGARVSKLETEAVGLKADLAARPCGKCGVSKILADEAMGAKERVAALEEEAAYDEDLIRKLGKDLETLRPEATYAKSRIWNLENLVKMWKHDYDIQADGIAELKRGVATRVARIAKLEQALESLCRIPQQQYRMPDYDYAMEIVKTIRAALGEDAV